MSNENPIRVGAIVYATSQGLGHLARSFYRAGVIDEVVIIRHPHGDDERPTRKEWYPQQTPVLDRRSFVVTNGFRDFLNRIDCLLCFETPFDWQAVKLAKDKKIATVLIPMHEWYPERVPVNCEFDFMIFPSLLDRDVFRSPTYGGRYENCPYLPIPIDPPIVTGVFPRVVTSAKRFLHNAGWIGSRNHKGTVEVLQAVKHLDGQADWTLTIRSQNYEGLTRLIREYAPEVSKNQRVFIEGPVADECNLFARHDVYVAPEKYNGLSLPLQEAAASGMVVCTTDRYPTNVWYPGGKEHQNEVMIPVSRVERVRASMGHLQIEEAIVRPEDVAGRMNYLMRSPEVVRRFSVIGAKIGEIWNWKTYRPIYANVLRRFVEEIRS